MLVLQAVLCESNISPPISPIPHQFPLNMYLDKMRISGTFTLFMQLVIQQVTLVQIKGISPKTLLFLEQLKFLLFSTFVYPFKKIGCICLLNN